MGLVNLFVGVNKLQLGIRFQCEFMAISLTFGQPFILFFHLLG